MKSSIRKWIACVLIVLFTCATAGCRDPFAESGKLQDGKYNITIACQAKDGEVSMLRTLKEAYEAKNPDVNIVISDFGDESTLLDSYMTNYASMKDKLPMMIWVPDDLFALWAKGGNFIDLRPFYEQDESTDYSLYYESMLHAASYSGEFRPTTSYSGDFVSANGNSDAEEYGLYFAPRDYNKIAIVYNTKLFNRFGIEVPDFTQNWNMETFIAFTQSVADKIKARGTAYGAYRALHLFTQWEPVYTTVFKAMGSDGLVQNGKLVLDDAKNQEIMDTLYDNLYSYDKAISTSDSFKQGTVCMDVICRSDFLNILLTLKDDDGSAIADFMPFPAEDIGAGCSGYAITKVHADEVQTVNGVSKTTKEICWDFIKYILSEEGQELAGSTGLLQPILKSLEENGAWRSAVSKDLNHDAFVAGNELRLTTYNTFDPVYRTKLRGLMTDFFQTLEDKTEGKNDSEHRQKYISNIMAEFNSLAV